MNVSFFPLALFSPRRLELKGRYRLLPYPPPDRAHPGEPVPGLIVGLFTPLPGESLSPQNRFVPVTFRTWRAAVNAFSLS